MRRPVKRYSIQFIKISGIALALIAGGTLLYSWEVFGVTVLAYLLSFLFVAANIVVLQKLNAENHHHFYRVFLWSIAGRFIFIIACLFLVYGAIKIHQILFTVSFIISYIFHSINEIIFINKILETDS